MNDEPAFPVGRDVTQDQFAPSSGMTLRDYFAAKAMQGLIENGSTIPKEIAQASYILADAMLAAREAK